MFMVFKFLVLAIHAFTRFITPYNRVSKFVIVGTLGLTGRQRFSRGLALKRSTHDDGLRSMSERPTRR